jgi:hypothetical protein
VCTGACLEAELLGRCVTDLCREPSEVGRAPGGAARIAESMSAHPGVQPERSGLERAESIVTGAGEVPYGGIFHGGDLHRGEVTRAHQAGQLYGVATGGVHPAAHLLGKE